MGLKDYLDLNSRIKVIVFKSGESRFGKIIIFISSFIILIMRISGSDSLFFFGFWTLQFLDRRSIFLFLCLAGFGTPGAFFR